MSRRSRPFIFFFVCLIAACSRLEPLRSPLANNTAAKPARTVESIHLTLGNPSNAGDDPNNYLVAGNGSAFSYNNSRGTINWIAWRTTKADLGEQLERPDFRPDTRLPRTFRRIVSSDYSGAGYDRGHMVPSADRWAAPALNEETFFMTNIVPQAGALNQFPWQKFETFVRRQVRRGLDAYQIAGVYGEIGILKRKIVVPTNCWKIVVFLRPGTRPLEIDHRTHIIAVDMPNRAGLENDNWQKYRTTIRSIEEKTGYDFLSILPPEVQDVIEMRLPMMNL